VATRLIYNQAELERLLRSQSGPTVRDLIRRARQVENRAKQLCPVDTGRLRSSITQTPPIVSGSYVTIQVGTNVEYGAYLEYGTRFMSARPFLLPALQAAA
jgi:HK97 gp10 family phage protein